MNNPGNNILSRAFSAIVGGMNSVGTVLIFGLVVMINLDVFSRFLFNAPIDGVKELVELSIVAIVFLQLPDAVRAGRLTRSDGLYSRLQRSHPRFTHGLGAFFDIAGALFFVVIIMGSVPRLLDAWERNYFAGNKGIFVVPVWPVRLILVIGAATVVVVFLGMAWKHLAALTRNTGEES
jgi:TRAP-type C4-dicarboxylate transport system permease small subunit